MSSSIEWTDETWNPIVGCSRVSRGCERCYAERVAHRGMQDAHRGLTVLGKKGPRWTGEVRFLPARLATPLRWRRPRMVFVNSMSDLFHESVPRSSIAAILGVVCLTGHHTHQILTKRADRMHELLGQISLDEALYELVRVDPPAPGVGASFSRSVSDAMRAMGRDPDWPGEEDPATVPAAPPWAWFGVSVEDQATAQERIPHLIHSAAAVIWVSYEPALGPVDLTPWLESGMCIGPCKGHPPERPGDHGRHPIRGIDWLVAGGESGPGARPIDPAWVRSARDQCADAGVPFFFKQWGGVQKKAAGRELDGRTHDAMPGTA